MTNITSTLVKDLREASGAGMMDCKKALEETKGDLEAAKDWLRSKGLAKAAKKAGRVAAEGLVAVVNNGDKAAIIELNSETDFVAKNEEFRNLVRNAAQAALTTDGSVEAVKAAKTTEGKTVEQSITDAIAKIGENMSLRRSQVVNANGGKIYHYIHSAQAEGLGKIGVLVVLKGGNEELGKQVAMHIAANKPESLNTTDLPAESVEREKNIFREQAKESGKPDNVIEKMIEGRIRKFFEQVVLVEQAFVMNPDKKVKEVVSEAGAEILAFTQFTLGEGIQKEE
ncbi:MAG TPA: elongation factor Ts, partial [Alphaproteobacteria bacterium]|nr:elongation factor Ts [Alphaproteobacteria bacterium]